MTPAQRKLLLGLCAIAPSEDRFSPVLSNIHFANGNAYVTDRYIAVRVPFKHDDDSPDGVSVPSAWLAKWLRFAGMKTSLMMSFSPTKVVLTSSSFGEGPEVEEFDATCPLYSHDTTFPNLDKLFDKHESQRRAKEVAEPTWFDASKLSRIAQLTMGGEKAEHPGVVRLVGHKAKDPIGVYNAADDLFALLMPVTVKP